MDLAIPFGLEPKQGGSPRMGSSVGHPSNMDSAPRLGRHSTAAPLPQSPLAPARPAARFWGLIQPNLE